MIDAVLARARPAIRAMTAYSSARSIATDGAVFLDANETPWPPSDDPRDAELNRYPHPQPPTLRRALATLYGVRDDQLFIGRGTDEAIDTLVRTFCEARQSDIIICPPTYGMYAIAAQIQGAGILDVPLRHDFTIDPPAICAAAQHDAVTLIFLCSPNNPTGRSIAWNDIATICRSVATTALVVVDEAYVEFADAPSCTARVDECPNLVVLRTLSKAWGFAGARCGVAIAHPQIIALLQKVRAPYPISLPSEQAVAAALTPAGAGQCRARISVLRAERSWLAEQLRALRCVQHIYPSDANFLLLRVTDAAALVAHCRARGVIIRDRSGDAGLANHVRISIGTRDEHLQLLAAWRELEPA